jgi:hypothetical protein
MDLIGGVYTDQERVRLMLTQPSLLLMGLQK